MLSYFEIVGEAIRRTANEERVTLPVNGHSMLPFVVGWRDCIILQKLTQPKVGDVVVAWVEGRRYVLHRIIRIEGDRITLMGDGNLKETEHCRLEDVKALATRVVDVKGRTHDLYSKWRRCTAKVWWYVRPVRRYLLAIYRRTHHIVYI
ncbi:MAG: S24/S26 family peptidase [Bacteroidaceae bacterium]|nr:S24/S26 family peptidase [Bacteroidaceae bacterium]